MGKLLIIKGADFSQNALDDVDIETLTKYIPNLVSKNIPNYNASLHTDTAYFAIDPNVQNGTKWFLNTDATNELVGKKIRGFKIRFNNNKNNANIPCSFTFSDDGGEDIVIQCESGAFENGEIYRDKVYMLPRDYTFQSTDRKVSIYLPKGTGWTDGSTTRGGCVLNRYGSTSQSNIGSFIAQQEGRSVSSGYRYMPFLELYVVESE